MGLAYKRPVLWMRPWAPLLVIRVIAVFAVTLVAGEGTLCPENIRSFLADEGANPLTFQVLIAEAR